MDQTKTKIIEKLFLKYIKGVNCPVTKQASSEQVVVLLVDVTQKI